MELTVMERIMLLNTLPKEAGITTIKIVKNLKEELSFSEEEHIKFKIKTNPNGTISWDDFAEQKKDIVIGEKAMDIIKEALTTLDKNKKVTDNHLSIWEIFME